MLKNLKLAWKIGLGFGIIVTALIVVALFSFTGLRNAQSGLNSYSYIAQETNILGGVTCTMQGKKTQAGE